MIHTVHTVTTIPEGVIRSPTRTYLCAFELYLGDGAARPLPISVAARAEAASFAALAPPAPALGDGADPIIESFPDLDEDRFAVTSFLEGELHLVAFGERRLLWYPCQLGGKPRGPIRVAACRPTPKAPADGRLVLPGGTLFGVAPELVALLSATPRLGPAEVLCEECGREIAVDPEHRCRHYRVRRRLATVLAAVLPGLGHLALRQYQRGRWLAVAAGLLLSRLLYLGLPVVLGTLPPRPLNFVLPAGLYALAIRISWTEVRARLRETSRPIG